MSKRAMIYYLLLCLLLLGSETLANQVSVTFRVISNTLPDTAQIYITGNRSTLGNWNPGIRALSWEKEGTWSRTFEFPYDTHLEYKITRGNWETEAVDSTGVEYSNFTLDITKDTTIILFINYWRDMYSDRVVVSLDRLEKKAGYLEFYEKWKFHNGDDPRWADPDWDDHQWPEVRSTLSPDDLKTITWNGTGWFRLKIEVDSMMWRKPLAINLRLAGTADVFLNGRHLYSFGKVDTSAADQSPASIRIPRYILFDQKKEQLFAIRYSNVASDFLTQVGADIGFIVYLRELNASIAEIAGLNRDFTIFQMVFTIMPLTLAFLHLLLYIFYRKMRVNLYFGIFMICFAILSFSDFQQEFVQTIPTVLIWIHISFASVILIVLFGLLTSYQRAFSNIPKLMYIFIGYAVLLLGWYFVSPNRQINIFFYIYLILSGIELIRVNITNLFKKDKWEWVIGLGFLIMIIIVAYQLLISNAVVEPIGNQTLVYVYGILIVSITTSLNLARDFSKVQEKVFAQEREAKDRELKRRILEADNIRKTQELEEARKLQLSMLPETIPQLPHLDIAVYMKTATEVGGDYYDFKLEQDGALTVVIGDATGHGTKAGMMVALVKNIFNSMGHTFFIPDFFKHTTKLIKQMNLGHLYMALLLMKIRKNHVTFSSAGMPPLFIYRTENKKIEEKVIKGLPLGGIESFNYEQTEFNIQPGDIILLMTDGFAELFNAQNDTIGFSRVKDILLQANQKNPDQIIQHFVEFGEKWRGGRQQNDDITFLILKMKSTV